MKYYFAPMEGITTHVFRAVHSRRFPGADRYYTPFFSPTSDHLFTPRELRELTPETPCAAPVVPQVLSKCAADIVWAAGGLQDMGYTVFNLNLGCPSATVTAKGKGAGLLQKPDALDTLLADVFAASPIAVSLKSRIGYLAPEEFPRLLSIYRQYDAQELILHPRTRKEMYSGTVHVETVCLLVLRNPVTHINIDVDVEEMVQDKRGLATYEQIKDYVLEHSGLKVSSLYIAQVKQKCGIIERENYNKPKSENAKQPQCPLEKERAITEALKHFGMI